MAGQHQKQYHHSKMTEGAHNNNGKNNKGDYRAG